MPSGSVLHVDPEAAAREALREALADSSLEVRSAASLAAGADALEEETPTCLVAEHDLQDGTGLELVSRVRETSPDVGCVVYTDAPRDAVAAADDDVLAEYVPKEPSASVDRLASVVRTTADRRTQTAYPLPDDEAERLEVLEAYDLESPALQRALGRVAELATTHFGLPLAAVSYLSADSQEFLVCEGDDWEAVSREETVCTYTILEPGVTVIEDLAEDPRFVANEALEELGIRFYAGVPLTDPGGRPLGTLCVYDDSPRTFDADEEAYLTLLAEEATQWLEAFGRDGDPAAAGAPAGGETAGEEPDAGAPAGGAPVDGTPAEDATTGETNDDASGGASR